MDRGTGRARSAVARLLGRGPQDSPSQAGAGDADEAPALTVIVAVHDVAAYLPECLDSLFGQTLKRLEVIAVDDGSTDECPAILAEYADRDPRLRVLTQANAGQGPARNNALPLARGEFVTFCDGDDTVPPRAYASVVRTLRSTGSDFAVGAVRRVSHGRVVGTPWGRVVHDRDRLGTTIDAFPDALRDIIACNRVFRADFLRAQVPAFRGGIAYEDHVPMLAAYLRAERFDVLARTTYNWRAREDNASTGQQKARLQNLLDRITVKDEASRMLQEEASPAVFDAWLARVIGTDFPSFVHHAAAAGDEYRSVLSATYRSFLDRADAEVLRHVDHRQKVRAWLCAEGRWTDLARVERVLADEGPLPPATVRDGRPMAVPDAAHPHLGALPPELLELSDQETPLRASLGAARWQDDRLQVWGYAAVRGISSGPAGRIEAWLRHVERGEELPLEARFEASPGANAWAGTRHADHAHARFRLEVPGDVLAARAAGDWSLELRVTRDGLVRTGHVLDAVEGSAGQLLAPTTIRNGRAVVLTPELSAGHGLVLRVAHGEDAGDRVAEPVPSLQAVAVHATGRGVEVRLAHDGPPPDLLLHRRHHDVAPVEVQSHLGGSTAVFATAEAPVVPSGSFALQATTDGTAQPVPAHPDLFVDLPCTTWAPGSRVTARLGAGTDLRVVLDPPLRDDEHGKVAQSALRTGFRTRSRDLVDAVLFWSVGGRFATGSPRAVDREVARRRPDLPRLWGVRDLSVALPAGAVPVLLDSRAWYDALATSRFVCADDDLGWWFDRAPGQRVLQTFEGQPFKAVGRTLWRSRGLGPEGIDLEVERANAQFGALVAPTDEAAALYRDQLGFTGDVLVTGLPGTDAVVTADREAVRADLLARLGIPPGTTVVLYAPTYRETSARLATRARAFDRLDLGALADALGPEVAVLLREHRSNRAEARRMADHERVHDVTGQPDVTELILAADVAVLDYSSLRFDWALTGRPAVCFVPDRERYFAARPPLFDYDRTTPGPQVTTLDELVAHLTDLPALAALAAPAIARMNAEFNPLHDGRASARVVDAFLG